MLFKKHKTFQENSNKEECKGSSAKYFSASSAINIIYRKTSSFKIIKPASHK